MGPRLRKQILRSQSLAFDDDWSTSGDAILASFALKRAADGLGTLGGNHACRREVPSLLCGPLIIKYTKH